MQTIDNWIEWKQKCALALCSGEAKQSLTRFVHARFARCVAAYLHTTNSTDPAAVVPDAGESWHRFESHFRLHAGPGGKSYKDWLFAAPAGGRAYSTQESVEAGASLLVRDVVREFLRREHSASWMVSTSAPASGSCGETPTVEELLPAAADTVAGVEKRELDRLAGADAEAAFLSLDRRERVAILVREAGVSLAHPDAVKAAGCGKSVLNEAFHSALSRVAATVRNRHPGEERKVQASLACIALERVRRLVRHWAGSETACSRFCRAIEGHRDGI